MSWWDGYRPNDRTGLLTGALELIDRGWPVMPGTYWQTDRWAGIPDAPRFGPVPVATLGAFGASRDPDVVEAWWSEQPYSVLVATGSVVDVIEVSALVGRRLWERLGNMSAPVGVSPTGRWWFAVAPCEALRPELAARGDVSLHGRGSWIVAPPTRLPDGTVRWRVPAIGDWRIPDTYEVQQALLEVLGQRPVLACAAAAAGTVATGVHS